MSFLGDSVPIPCVVVSNIYVYCNSIFVAYIHEKGEEQSWPYCNKTCYCWMGNDCETPCAECKNLANRGFAMPGARAPWLGGGSSLSIGTDVTAISYRRIIIY